ncbi:MAG: diguanylate cyclase, partial [Thermoanaerobaculia bacterium]
MAEETGKGSSEDSLAAEAQDPPEPTGWRWDPELARCLQELLRSTDIGSRPLSGRLEEFEKRFGKYVYSELIYMICHLRFEPEEAESHWRQLGEHRAAMEESLGSPVDLRVALASYFIEVQKKLENPKVIEMRLFEQTQAFAYLDDLTGLRNYRYLNEALEQEIDRSDRHDGALSLVMIDVDDFKQYNDRNGHGAGNEALAVIGRILAESVRDIDTAARYGGEEFVVVMPSSPKTGAQLAAERIRRAIEGHRFPHEEGQPGGRLTVSVGVATYPGDAVNAADLIRRSDRAMYHAKRQGKNRVGLYGESRRSFQRLAVSLDGTFTRTSLETSPLQTVDLSERGVCFVSERQLPVQALADVSLTLLPDRKIAFAGRVVRSVERDDGRWQTALVILD